MAVICRLVSPTAMFFASEPITQPSSASASMISIRGSTPSSEQESPSSSSPSSVKTSPSPSLLSTSADSGGLYGGSTSFLKKSIVQQRRQFVSKPRHLFVHQPRQYQRRSSYGQGHPLTQQIQDHLHSGSQMLHPNRQHKKTRSIHLADKFQDAMSSPQLQSSLNGTFGNSETSAQARDDAQSEESDYVYTAPCEHHPSKGQTDYLINDMFPKLEHDLSTIEFGIRIADFMPLAFKTVPVSGLAERELELLRDIHCLPNVIQLQDSFVNDNGDTVLVLPMLKRFECNAVNESICSVRKVIKQVLTGLAAVHAKNIVHLDINPSNLMVTHTKRDVIIIDFGLSTTVNRKGTNSIPVCGTTGYIAPEILNRQKYGDYDPTGADIYSLGIVLGEMLEPYIPDCDLHYFGSKYLAPENTKTTVSLLNGFISQTSVYPRVLIQAADLLKCMLEENPRERKSAQELLDCHPFFAACPGTEEPKATLKLCEWVCRVQEIKYQRYLCEEREECEVYRYR